MEAERETTGEPCTTRDDVDAPAGGVIGLPPRPARAERTAINVQHNPSDVSVTARARRLDFDMPRLPLTVTTGFARQRRTGSSGPGPPLCLDSGRFGRQCPVVVVCLWIISKSLFCRAASSRYGHGA